jgi:hypothetical protein
MGEMVRYFVNPLPTPHLEAESVQIEAKVTDLSADGWLDVNRVIQNRFVDFGRDPTTIPLFSWVPTPGNLMRISTHLLPTADDVPVGVANAGQEVPAGSRISIQKISLRFETRNANTHGPLPGSGKTLNSMVVNTNSVFLKLAIKEQTDNADLCGIIHVNAPHISYTVYHPHLQSANIHVNNNSHTYEHDLNDPEPPAGTQRLPLSGNIDPAVVNLNRLDLNLPGTLTKCAYLVALTAVARLHNGDIATGNAGPVNSLFYFDPAP